MYRKPLIIKSLAEVCELCNALTRSRKGNSMKQSICMLLAVVVFTGMFGYNAVAKDEITIAGIVFQEDQFMRIVQIGMDEAAEKAGVKLLKANSNNKLDKEIQLVDTYIARGVDAIAITALSSKASIPALKKAHEKGIKIITFNSPIEADFPVSYINSSQLELGSGTGKVARKYIEEQLGGKAKVAVLAFDSLLPEISDERVQGFLNELEGLDYELVARQDAWLAEAATKKGGDIITANPEVDILYAANEGGTVGAVMAVKSAGKADKIKVFGIDASEQLANFLLAEDNILQAVTGQQPIEIGIKSIEMAVNAVKGDPVEAMIIVPGLVLQRSEPDNVNEYKVWLKSVIQ